MKVINLFGGPGSGKSTTAAGLFYFMKLRHISVELVTEYAKDLVWSNRLEDMLDQQEYIFAKQNHRIHRLRGKVDYAIVDSPLLLSYAYPKANEEQKGVEKWPAIDAFLEFVVKVYSTYTNENFYLMRPDSYQEGGREHDIEQAKRIDDIVSQTLTDLKVPFFIVPTNEHTIPTILEHLGVKNEATTN